MRQRMRPPACEICGEVLLLLAEDVHREGLHRVNGLTCFRRLPHTEEHERRIERDGGKRVDRQRADRPLDLGRDDRHARGELSDGLAKRACVESSARTAQAAW